MIIAKDPFLSWEMISTRGSRAPELLGAGARYSFFQARNAIYHSIELLGIRKGSHVLVPAYICRVAIDPFLASGLEVDFYAVRRDCSIDLADLEKRITPETKAILVVHYFGFPQPLRDLRRLCDGRGIALIEDCAHVLVGQVDGQPMGTVGDAAVFSWRKFLPLYDGADLVVSRPKKPGEVHSTAEKSLFTLKVAANMLEASLGQTRQPLLRLAYQSLRAAQQLFRKCTSGRLGQSAMMQAEITGLTFDLHSADWPMSRVSRWTKRHSDIARIVERRRHNYETLLREVSSELRLKPLFATLPADMCPWIFPLWCEGLEDAHLSLRSGGIPAVTWGGVRHPRIEEGLFADSDFLYDNLMFLPVHQCLTDEDMIHMARALKALY